MDGFMEWYYIKYSKQDAKEETSFLKKHIIVATAKRGTEWAATGNVTQKTVPADFPTETQKSTRHFELKK